MGCLESYQKEVRQRAGHDRLEPPGSPEITRLSSELPPVEVEFDEPHSIYLGSAAKRKLTSRPSTASFSINLNESLDSRLSLSFKSQTPSATSLASSVSVISNASNDSGVYDEFEEEYSHVITEHAHPDVIWRVEKEFRPKTHLELCVLGVACPRGRPGSRAPHRDEQAVLRALRDEGLIQRPHTAAPAGLSFEVISVDALPESKGSAAGRRFLPPIKLQRRNKRRKSEAEPLTQDAIREKLNKAEERRKQQEERRLHRLNAATRPKSAVVRQVVQRFQENARAKYEQKLEIITENREKRLQQLQERLRQQRERSAKVRLRRMLNPYPQEEAIAEEEA